MIIKTCKTIPSSEITDPAVFKQRRQLIKAMLALGITGSGIYSSFADATEVNWQNVPKGYQPKEPLSATSADIVKNHTNYYEFTYN